jgi:Xaa-Pro aminopeptidase
VTDLGEIQATLRTEGLDGWLFFDHHVRDPLAYRILGLDPQRTPTRRWYYLIPAAGEPRGLVHRIEAGVLDALPGPKTAYSSWKEQWDGLGALLQGVRAVAMQYSPRCAIPYVAMVDAGTVELVRSFGVDVRSSADLVQYFEARWTPEQLEAHLEAGRRVDEIRRRAFGRIGEALRGGRALTEWDVKRFILEAFERDGLVTDHGPIVAVNENASNPHYEPFADSSRPIRPGDWVLIDLWAKLRRPEAVYYDITWTGYCGSLVPSPMAEVFEVVREARDRAVRRVQDAVARGEALCGFQVDDTARDYIRSRGFGEYFIHRTGHSIGRDIHGAGANMDNLETHDERRIIAHTCFSIEPGIYLAGFGVRSEVNVFAGEDAARVTGEIQQAPLAIATL